MCWKSIRKAKTKPRARFCGDDCGRCWTNDDENVAMAKFLASPKLRFFLVHNLQFMMTASKANCHVTTLFMATTSLLRFPIHPAIPCDFATDFNGFFNGILLKTLTEVYFLKRFFVACSCVCVFDSMRDFRQPGSALSLSCSCSSAPFLSRRFLFHCVLLECRFTWTEKGKSGEALGMKKAATSETAESPKNRGKVGWREGMKIENRDERILTQWCCCDEN